MSASDWIKMTRSLWQKPEVVRISSRMKWDRMRTVGALYRVWCLADDQTSDGFIPHYTFALIDEDVGTPGLCEAMAEVGWLIETAQGVEVPKFERHNGDSAKRRATETERKRQRRASEKCPQSVPEETGQIAPCSNLVSSDLVSSSDSGSSEGGPGETTPERVARSPAPRKPAPAHADDPACWDWAARMAIFRAYPKSGQAESGDALEAIGEAAEWIRASRPDLGPPMDFLKRRVTEYAASPAGKGHYVPMIAKWMRKRRFNDAAEVWARGDKPKRKSYLDMLAENGEAHAATPETHP